MWCSEKARIVFSGVRPYPGSKLAQCQVRAQLLARSPEGHELDATRARPTECVLDHKECLWSRRVGNNPPRSNVAEFECAIFLIPHSKRP